MSGIEWTKKTWNPVVGCTRVSAGCDHCYAVAMTHRQGAMAEAAQRKGKNAGRSANYIGLTVLNNRGDRHFTGEVRCVEEALTIPLGWKKPRTVFVNSMGDLFHKDVPFEFIDRVFAVMKITRQHTYQVLTKRPDRMRAYFEDRSSERAVSRGTALHEFAPDEPLEGDWPLPNVWLGTSVEDQRTADERIPDLLACPAAVRFLSCEPLLGPVDFQLPQSNEAGDEWYASVLRGAHSIDWVIVGGESGSNARWCEVSWIRSIMRECRAGGVPVFVKQLGSNSVSWGSDDETETDWEFYESRGHRQTPDCWFLPLQSHKGNDMAEWPEDLRVREMPRTHAAMEVTP